MGTVTRTRAAPPAPALLAGTVFPGLSLRRQRAPSQLRLQKPQPAFKAKCTDHPLHTAFATKKPNHKASAVSKTANSIKWDFI